MKVGDLIKYRFDESYVGVIIEIGSNMFRIIVEHREDRRLLP